MTLGDSLKFTMAFVAFATTSPAWACSPAYYDAFTDIKQGEFCSAYYRPGPGPNYFSASLGEAETLEYGQVLQKAQVIDGSGIGDYYVFTDCASKEVVIFGVVRDFCDETENPIATRLYGDILVSHELQRTVSINEILRRAKNMNVPEIIQTNTSRGLWLFKKIKSDIKPFSLDCGCAALYPELESTPEMK
jgi:hypothetical protein